MHGIACGYTTVWRPGLHSVGRSTVPDATTYNAPTIIWRLQREGVFAYAIIVPRGTKTKLTWWIDDRLEDIDEFPDWTLALEHSETIRRQLLDDGWTDVG